MDYTKIPTTTFQKLQLNAGVVATGFTPATGAFTGQIGATQGGSQFSAVPTYTDFGEDIDNCPKNMMELKKLESWEVKLSGTLVTVDLATAKMLIAACDVDGTDSTKLVPRNDVKTADFDDIWFICDYSDVNETGTGSTAGFIAIKVLNALNTGGFQLKSADKAKGTFSFEFTGHYSMDAQDTVPFEVYIKAGSTTP